MKKIQTIILLAVLALFANSTAILAGTYGMAGCGLGSLVITANDITQIFAATTNATAYSQFFGITTGTSNCTKDGIVTNEKQQEVFVHLNFQTLEKEMATGKGEKLNALATLVGCSKNIKGFNQMAKSNYNKLFKDSDPSILLVSLKEEISKDANLKASCTL
ncbi:MAG: DUF3015 family protein [Leptospiraceae bacterium]|nr:DUF3015 family protein [Leptospiraceae bacterium]